MKKRICIISTKKPSSFGGAEVVWKNLSKFDFNFENISLDDSDLPGYYKIIPMAFHLREIFASGWMLRKALRGGFDIVIYDKIFGWPRLNVDTKKICYNHGSYSLAGLTFKKKNYFVYLFYKYIVGYFERRSYENADKIIAVSKSVRDEMVNYFGISEDKILVVDNAVALNRFKPIKDQRSLRKKYNLPVNKRILFFPGRASFGKGFDIAESVMKRLGNKYLLIVLGGGSSKLDNVKFIGKVDNDDMVEVYNLSDACVFPSRYEGNSVSVLESAACGVPLVLSNVGLMITENEMNEFVCDSVDEYVDMIKGLDVECASKRWRDFSKNYSLKKQSSKLMEILENEK